MLVLLLAFTTMIAAAPFSRISRCRWLNNSFLALHNNKSLSSQTLFSSSPMIWSLLLRGGSAATDTPATSATTNDPQALLQAYRWQQQLYLSSRSLQLRQALIGRGLSELQHSVKDTAANSASAVTDWDCAVSSDQHPKSCLYSLDAEVGAKVIAPATTITDKQQQHHQWITVSALNRLRRNDPTKVEPLWHSQYAILSTWFSPTHPFSVATHLTATGTLLNYLLDSPHVLTIAMSAMLILTFLLTLPVWESLGQTILTFPALWHYWPTWGRFVHAALPLKLLIGQVAFNFLQSIFFSLYARIRSQLVEWECRMLEECLPITILEDDDDIDDDDDAVVSFNETSSESV